MRTIKCLRLALLSLLTAGRQKNQQFFSRNIPNFTTVTILDQQLGVTKKRIWTPELPRLDVGTSSDAVDIQDSRESLLVSSRQGCLRGSAEANITNRENGMGLQCSAVEWWIYCPAYRAPMKIVGKWPWR